MLWVPKLSTNQFFFKLLNMIYKFDKYLSYIKVSIFMSHIYQTIQLEDDHNDTVKLLSMGSGDSAYIKKVNIR